MISTRECVDLRRVLREHRLGAPPLGEISDRALLDLIRQTAVRLVPTGSLCAVVYTCGGGDQNQPLDPLRRSPGDVQRDAPTHRIAREHEALGSALEPARDTPLERDRARRLDLIAMPGEVERERTIALSRQILQNRIPGPRGTAKAMQENNILSHMLHPMSYFGCA